MLNASIARARIADRNSRAERESTNRQLLASFRPEKQPHRHRWRNRRTWTRATEHAPVRA